MKKDDILNKLTIELILDMQSSLEVYDPSVIKNKLKQALEIGAIDFKYNVKRGGRERPVTQMDEYGKIISEFTSVKSASLSTGISSTVISFTCSGRQNTGGGFHWRYKKEN